MTSLSLFTFMHWRRKWQPTPVFLPGGPQGRWSLVRCRLWGLTESDTTEATQQQQQQQQPSCVQFFTIPWTVAHQAPLSILFPRQEYWSGLSFPAPEDLLNPEIRSMSPALAGRFFTTELPGSPPLHCTCCCYCC